MFRQAQHDKSCQPEPVEGGLNYIAQTGSKRRSTTGF